jgi:hypothetical protein
MEHLIDHLPIGHLPSEHLPLGTTY